MEATITESLQIDGEEINTKQPTISEQMFGKRWRELNEEEKKIYHKKRSEVHWEASKKDPEFIKMKRKVALDYYNDHKDDPEFKKLRAERAQEQYKKQKGNKMKAKMWQQNVWVFEPTRIHDTSTESLAAFEQELRKEFSFGPEYTVDPVLSWSNDAPHCRVMRFMVYVSANKLDYESKEANFDEVATDGND